MFLAEPLLITKPVNGLQSYNGRFAREWDGGKDPYNCFAIIGIIC